MSISPIPQSTEPSPNPSSSISSFRCHHRGSSLPSTIQSKPPPSRTLRWSGCVGARRWSTFNGPPRTETLVISTTRRVDAHVGWWSCASRTMHAMHISWAEPWNCRWTSRDGRTPSRSHTSLRQDGLRQWYPDGLLVRGPERCRSLQRTWLGSFPSHRSRWPYDLHCRSSGRTHGPEGLVVDALEAAGRLVARLGS